MAIKCKSQWDACPERTALDSPGTLAGIVVGSLAVTGAFVAIANVYRRRRRSGGGGGGGGGSRSGSGATMAMHEGAELEVAMAVAVVIPSKQGTSI